MDTDALHSELIVTPLELRLTISSERQERVPTADTLFPRMRERCAWPPKVPRHTDGCHARLRIAGMEITPRRADLLDGATHSIGVAVAGCIFGAGFCRAGFAGLPLPFPEGRSRVRSPNG